MIFCPTCKGVSRVVDSRVTGNSIRRRRRCESCGERWSTYEVDSGVVAALNDVEQHITAIAAMAPTVSTAIEDYEVRRYQFADVVSKAKPGPRSLRRRPVNV